MFAIFVLGRTAAVTPERQQQTISILLRLRPTADANVLEANQITMDGTTTIVADAKPCYKGIRIIERTRNT